MTDHSSESSSSGAPSRAKEAIAAIVLLLGFAAVAVVAVVGIANGQSDDGGTEAAPEPAGPDGGAVYEARCVACHGAAGEGGVGPALGDGAVAAAYPDIADQIAVITNGRNAMPAWGEILSDEEIAAVAAYERDELGH